MRKSMAFMLVILLVTTLFTGCGGTQDTSNSELDNDSIVVYGYYSEPILDWDPSIMYSNGAVILHNVYETLLRFNITTKEFEKVLAEDYSVSDDGLVWTFNIRKGVKFHDGTDLNAEAVKFSFERTKEMGKGAAYLFESVESITALDDYTVEIKLKNEAPLDLIVSASFGAFIFSPTAVKNNPENWFQDGNEAGTGPYMLQTNKMGSEVILKAFDDYWKGWEGNHFAKAVVKNIPESSSRRQLVEQGDIDVTGMLPYEDIEALKNNENVNINSTPSIQNVMIHYNTENELLSNPKIREALSYAFPYEDVIKYALGGYGKQSKGVVPEVHWGHGEDLFQYSLNLEKAKELLTEAGYPDGGFKLVYTYMSGDELERKIAELYKAELQKLNVNLEIRGMTWDSQWELSRHVDPNQRQDLFIMYHYPDYSSPYGWFKLYFASEEEIVFNLSYYKNKEFDNLIDSAEALAGRDINKAEAMFIDAQKMLIEDNTSIFVCDLKEQWVTNKSLKGFKYNPLYSSVVYFYDLYSE